MVRATACCVRHLGTLERCRSTLVPLLEGADQSHKLAWVYHYSVLLLLLGPRPCPSLPYLTAIMKSASPVLVQATGLTHLKVFQPFA